MSRRRFLLLSPCGWGNLGDAAILDSAIAALRARVPDAEILGVTLNPADTRARHGIDALPLRSASREGYEIGPAAASSAGRRADAADRPGALRRLARAVPFARRAWRSLQDARASVRDVAAVEASVHAGDTLVVAGGGQLDDFWGGPSGHPRSLALWHEVVSRTGGRTLVLSVGTGRVTPGSHDDLRRVLAAAGYVSFRDALSRTLAAAVADVSGAGVVPDLAYAVPLPPFAPAGPSGPRVAVLPMVYRAPRAWPDADASAYELYLARTAALVTRLVERGASVTLCASGRSDERALDDLGARVADRRVTRAPAPDVPALLCILRAANAVVASRLHGVLLAHVAGRPAAAVAHERKVWTLMHEVGQTDDCFDIDAFDPHAVAERALAAVEAGETLAARVAEDAAQRRALVEAQYDAVFGPRP